MPSTAVLTIPREGLTKQSVALSVLVHLLLLAFLWIGVSWQSEQGGSVDAEVWDITVREAAPLAQVAEPEIVHEDVADDSLVKEETSEPVVDKSLADPNIALQEEKKKEETKKQAEEKKKAEDKKKQAEAEKRRQLSQADQEKANALLAAEAQRLAARSGSGGSGTAPYSTGPRGADAGYVQQVGAKIKSNTLFNVPDNLNGNPAVEYDVELLPDGSVKNIRKRKSSGVAGFDEAVYRAIEKSVPYPRDKSGRVPSGFIVTHKPKG